MDKQRVWKLRWKVQRARLVEYLQFLISVINEFRKKIVLSTVGVKV